LDGFSGVVQAAGLAIAKEFYAGRQMARLLRSQERAARVRRNENSRGMKFHAVREFSLVSSSAGVV
jgi:hypothetical protein